jgi:hypothetical protein
MFVNKCPLDGRSALEPIGEIGVSEDVFVDDHIFRLLRQGI